MANSKNPLVDPRLNHLTAARYLAGGFELWAKSGRSIYNQHGKLIVKEFEKSEEM